MVKKIIIKVFICFGVGSLCLFSYLERQNELTHLKLYAPKILKGIKALEEENTRLAYEIDQFESPENMMALARDIRFCHLRHPLRKEVVMMQEGIALQYPLLEDQDKFAFTTQYTLAVGAK